MLPALNREFQQFTLDMSFARHEADPLLKE